MFCRKIRIIPFLLTAGLFFINVGIVSADGTPTSTPTPTVTTSPTLPYCEYTLTPKSNGLIPKITIGAPITETPTPNLSVTATITPNLTFTKTPTSTATVQPSHLYKLIFSQPELSFDACYPNCSNHTIYGQTFSLYYPDRLIGKYWENTCTATGGHSGTGTACTSNISFSCYVQLNSWSYTPQTYKRCSVNAYAGLTQTPNQICQEAGGIDSVGSGFTTNAGTYEYWTYSIGSDAGSGLKCTYKQYMYFYGNHDPGLQPTATPTSTPIQPTKTPFCQAFDDLYANHAPIAVNNNNFVGQTCYSIFPGLSLDMNTLPNLLKDTLTVISAPLGVTTLPTLAIPTISICLDRYNVNLSLLGIDFMPLIGSVLALLAVGSLLNEIRS